jgi:dipeptidase D
MKDVFEYFEEILKIPRESGKEEKIARYLESFAKENNIEYKLGKYNTVYLRKNNNSNKTIILQAHSDMVCVSSEKYDFDNKGIPFFIDGDYYKSKNTSLGADDGIGIAIILAILQENKNMPNIEVIVTTQEETTMLGATNFDYSIIKGNTLISLDGIKEGNIESSSAGMCSILINKKINYKILNGKYYKLSISGLKGGHSGDDIDKNRCNAIKLAVVLLQKLNCLSICDINFGKGDNVIPSDGYVVFSSNDSIDIINENLKNIKIDLGSEKNNLKLKIEKYETNNVIEESNDIIEFISKINNGLIDVYKDDGFPLLSANIGKISIEKNLLEIKYSIRSSDLLQKEELLNEIIKLANKYEFDLRIIADKPFFPYKDKSIIRNILSKTYEELYGKKTTINKVHACMEGGILSNNIKDLDICVIAPTIENCHSINERVSISSTKRVYEWLKQSLIKYNIS